MDKITRKAASTAQRGRYFTGVACRNKHVAERYVSTGKCVNCRAAQKRREPPGANAAYLRRYRDSGKAAETRAARRAPTCECCTKESRAAVYKEARDKELTVDHIIPISKDGPHCVHNLQLLTLRANSEKRSRYDPMVEGMQYLRNIGLA